MTNTTNDHGIVTLGGVSPPSREAIAALPEPRTRALISCQLQSGPATAWVDRTYEVIRSVDGCWLVDFGEGRPEPRRDWRAVLDWLWRLCPRNVELLEDP